MAEETNTVVFVVSDDPLVRDEVRYGFPLGTDVKTFDDATDARLGMDEQVPDVVIVELQTGQAGGFCLARDMRASKKLVDIPILMLVDREQDGWLALQSGAKRYRVKPLPAASLAREALDLLSA